MGIHIHTMTLDQTDEVDNIKLFTPTCICKTITIRAAKQLIANKIGEANELL